MPTTYYYHVNFPDTRIKITKKSVTWERNVITNLNDVIDKNAEPTRAWRYHLRHPLPVKNAEDLRVLYNLPEDAVTKLK
jgi:hypothetical protein